jgi:hypothetical protein
MPGADPRGLRSLGAWRSLDVDLPGVIAGSTARPTAMPVWMGEARTDLGVRHLYVPLCEER